MKKTKRSLFISIVTLLLCSAMFVGSTFAWFTDTVSNTGNRIQAGTLKVDLLMDKELDGNYTSIAGGHGDIFDEADKAQDSNKTLWEPGKTQIVYLAVKNKGNLALKYNIYLDVTDEGLIVGKDSKKTSLEYAIIPGASKANPVEQTNWVDLKASSQSGDIAFSDNTKTYERLIAAPNGKIVASDDETVNTEYFALAVHMKEDAGNEYQGKDAIIDVTVVATQATYEEDGFGTDQYDKDAKFPTIKEPIHVSVKTEEPVQKGHEYSATDITSFTTSGTAIQEAKVASTAVAALIPNNGATINGKTIEVSDNVDLDLNLKVDTEKIEEESVTFEIGLEKTITVYNGDSTLVKAIKTSTVTDQLSSILTAKLQVGTGLNNVNVKHNDVDMQKLENADADPGNSAVGGYFYDAIEGILTIKASKFSPFTVEYELPVAKIGNKEYASLADAITDVNNGDTIVVLKNISNAVGISVPSDKKFTVDFKGHTYTINNPGAGSAGTRTQGFQLLQRSTITFKNGTINVDPSNKNFTWGSNDTVKGIAWLINSYCDLTLDNMVIDGSNLAKNLASKGGQSSDDVKRYVLVCQTNNMTIKDTTVIAADGDYAVYTEFEPDGYTADACTTITGKSNIKGLLFCGNNDKSKLSISSGKFDHDPKDYVADNCGVEKNTDGTWNVKDLWSEHVAEEFESINTEEKTIEITTPEQLALLAKRINSGSPYSEYTITIKCNLDMSDHIWVPINARNGNISGATIKGENNVFISGLIIDRAVYRGNYDYYAGFIAQIAGSLTIKDLVFESATSVDYGSGVAVVLGLTYSNVTMENVVIKNSSINAETKAGAFVGFTGGDGVKVTLKNCSVENVIVKAEYSYALMVGLINTTDSIEISNCTATNSHCITGYKDFDEATQILTYNGTIEAMSGCKYGIDNSKLWLVETNDCWAEKRSSPAPQETINDEKYTIYGDKILRGNGTLSE